VGGAAPAAPAAPQLDLDQERESARRARWGAVLLGGGQLVTAVVFAVLADGVGSMIRFAADHPASEEVPPGAGQVAAATVGSSIVSPLSLIGLILLLVWFHRAVSNGRALGYRPPREPAFAVASWFIPIVNLWWPYESLRESVGAHDGSTRALLLRWWITYLVAGFVGFVGAPLVAVWRPLGLAVAAGVVAVVVVEVRLTWRVLDQVLASHVAAGAAR
jgi:hypothetical protein